MSEWKGVKLGEYIETNKRSIGKDYQFSNIFYLDTGSITENRIDGLQEFNISDAPIRAKRLVQENDIIYSTVRPNQLHYGFIKNPKENLVISTGFVVITCNQEKLEPKFLFYYLSSDTSTGYLHSIAEASTSAYPSLKPSDIGALEIDLPPLPKQKAIAEVLSSLDDKIDLLHRQNKTLEQMAETLFRQWFPPKGRRTGIEEAKKDWEIGVMPDEFDFLMGQSPKGTSFNEIGIGTPMYQGNADFDFRFPNRRIYTTEAKRLAQKYDTLISVRAPVGEQNMAFEECCIGRGVAAFKYKANSEYYTYTYFKMRSLMDEIKQFNNEGTVFGSISKSDFQSLKITIPPQTIVDKFQDEAKPIDDKVIGNTIQIRTLEKMRDALLPKLMSGEVGVKIKGQNDYEN